MFAHGWGGGSLVDLSKGQEMLGWYGFCLFAAPMLTLLGRYSTSFVMCSLLHVFSSTSLDARISGAKKQKGKESVASTALLQALEGKGARRSGRGEDVNSSDADGGIEGEESSNDDDYGTVESARGDKHRKHSPTTPSELPSSLMRALTAPPPSPLNLTSEDFIRDFLSKYPPSPKSYEVTADTCYPFSPTFTLLSQLSIGSKVRRLSKQVCDPFQFLCCESSSSAAL